MNAEKFIMSGVSWPSAVVFWAADWGAAIILAPLCLRVRYIGH